MLNSADVYLAENVGMRVQETMLQVGLHPLDETAHRLFTHESTHNTERERTRKHTHTHTHTEREREREREREDTYTHTQRERERERER